MVSSASSINQDGVISWRERESAREKEKGEGGGREERFKLGIAITFPNAFHERRIQGNQL